MSTLEERINRANAFVQGMQALSGRPLTTTEDQCERVLSDLREWYATGVITFAAFEGGITRALKAFYGLD